MIVADSVNVLGGSVTVDTFVWTCVSVEVIISAESVDVVVRVDVSGSAVVVLKTVSVVVKVWYSVEVDSDTSVLVEVTVLPALT